MFRTMLDTDLLSGGPVTFSVSGFKSLYENCNLEVRPLTILAGANSSGKSSMMQPFLLMKQTLDSSFDPGALLLSGPNANFTKVDQIFSRKRRDATDRIAMTVRTRQPWIDNKSDISLSLEFSRGQTQPLDVTRMTTIIGGKEVALTPIMDERAIRSVLTERQLAREQTMAKAVAKTPAERGHWQIRRNRCFLAPEYVWNRYDTGLPSGLFMDFEVQLIVELIQGIIHVPGLRGNPARTYPSTVVGSPFPGTFDHYVASVISQWHTNKDERLALLAGNMRQLGLGGKIKAKRVDDANVELRVGRLRRGNRKGPEDLLSIADVGFGVSQTLPVLVSLLAAGSGQIVYIEQPEIHLHPRAQSQMASVLVDAAKRGVFVIVETHSAQLLLEVQTAVAKKRIRESSVSLNWFTQDDEGHTRIVKGELDRHGAYGDWPEDFSETSLRSEAGYLDAATSRK